MSSWQFWLLLFSLWHSVVIQKYEGGIICGLIGLFLWAGSFIMIIWSIFHG